MAPGHGPGQDVDGVVIAFEPHVANAATAFWFKSLSIPVCDSLRLAALGYVRRTFRRLKIYTFAPHVRFDETMVNLARNKTFCFVARS